LRSLDVASAVVRRRADVVCASFARCRFRAVFPGFLSLPHAYINDLEIDLARNTLGGHECVCQVWSPSAQPFGRPYGTNKQANKHIAFYYIDLFIFYQYLYLHSDQSQRFSQRVSQITIRTFAFLVSQTTHAYRGSQLSEGHLSSPITNNSTAHPSPA